MDLVIINSRFRLTCDLYFGILCGQPVKFARIINSKIKMSVGVGKKTLRCETVWIYGGTVL